MSLPLTIDIAQKANGSMKDKGDLLEDLAQILFEKQQYDIVKALRKTGVEIDLSAKHKLSGKKAYIECKAWKDNLPADVITN